MSRPGFRVRVYPPRKPAETLPGGCLGTGGGPFGQLRGRGNLARDHANLFLYRRAVPRVREQLLDPSGGGGRVDVVLDEQSPEQDADADVREGAKGKLAARGISEGGEFGIGVLNLRDELANGLVDEREPELL